MPFGLPDFGELNWHTELNDSINSVKATADSAQASASSATSTANSANATAQAAQTTANTANTAAAAAQTTANTANTNANTALAQSGDSYTAGLVNNASSATRAALDALYAAGAVDVFKPESYSVVGNGTADDTTALNNLFTAAGAVGGIVHLWGGTAGDSSDEYKITGAVTIPSTCTVLTRRGTSQEGNTSGTRILCASSTARVNIGNWTGGLGRPGLVYGLTVDGNNTGDPTGIVRVMGQDLIIENIIVRSGAGDGICYEHVQNSITIGLVSTENAGTGLVLDKGCAGNQWTGGHIFNNLIEIHLKSDLAEAEGYRLPFSNDFENLVLESYSPTTSTMAIKAGYGLNNRFIGCDISRNSTQAIPIVEYTTDAAVGDIRFEGCYFIGRNAATYAIKTVQGAGGVLGLIYLDRNTFDIGESAAVGHGVTNSTIYFGRGQRYYGSLVPVESVGGALLTNCHFDERSTTNRYTTPQTDTAVEIPFGARYADLDVQGASGGAGGGARKPSGTASPGGYGGQGGGRSRKRILLSDVIGTTALTGTLYVTVGAKGTGGAGATADGGNGTAGTTGGESYVLGATPLSNGVRLASAGGGAGGPGGGSGSTPGTTAGQGRGTGLGGAGGVPNAAGTVGTDGSEGTGGAGAGGGCGGGVDTGTNTSNGTKGAAPVGAWNVPVNNAGTAPGGAGSAGTAPLYDPGAAGSGGGGGAGATATAGGNGAAGARGSGGGGGGGARNGNDGGTGADGGDGVVTITWIY